MRHGIVDESREGRRTIVLISPVLEAGFAPEDGMALCSLEYRGEQLLEEPARLAGAPGHWRLLAVERHDDDAHLQAEADLEGGGTVAVEARLADDSLELTSAGGGPWELAAHDPRVTAETHGGTLKLRVT